VRTRARSRLGVGRDVKAVADAGTDAGTDAAVSILPLLVMLLMQYSQPVYPRCVASKVFRRARRESSGEMLESAVKEEVVVVE